MGLSIDYRSTLPQKTSPIRTIIEKISKSNQPLSSSPCKDHRSVGYAEFVVNVVKMAFTIKFVMPLKIIVWMDLDKLF